MSKEPIKPINIMIVLNGSNVDNDVVKLACNMAVRSKGEVYGVYVIEIKRTLPLEAEVEPDIQKGEDILDHVERLAENYPCEVETALLQARNKGPAIVEEAMERDVDLIIMGINYEKPFGEFSLGTTLPYVLKHATCRVLVYRDAVAKELIDTIERPS